MHGTWQFFHLTRFWRLHLKCYTRTWGGTDLRAEPNGYRQDQLECVIKFEPDKDPLEAEDERWMERVRFKSTMEFLGLLEDYIMSMTDWIFSPADYTYESFTAKGGMDKGAFPLLCEISG